VVTVAFADAARATNGRRTTDGSGHVKMELARGLMVGAIGSLRRDATSAVAGAVDDSHITVIAAEVQDVRNQVR
jgi:hypothetical protein